MKTKTTLLRVMMLVMLPFLMASVGKRAWAQHLNFKHLTINEGLSQNTVFCVTQDKTGFIWIGTEDGLNKYDGYEFSIYKHEDNNPKSLSHSQINALQEDPRGNLWVGTSDGLNCFDKHTESFRKISTGTNSESGTNEFITSFLYDSFGNLWIGTFGGLKRYDYKTNKVVDYTIKSSNQSTGTSKRVQAIFEDADRTLWVSIGKNLKRIDLSTQKPMPLPAGLQENIDLSKSNIRVIKQSKNAELWFGTEGGGLYRYNILTNKTTHYLHSNSDNKSLPTNIIRSLLPYSDTEMWIGTRDGLSILNMQTNTFTNHKYNPYDTKTISHNSVRNIFRDRAGNIWLGTYAGGLNFFSSGGNNFSYIGEKSSNKAGLSHRVVSSIINNNGALWVGTEGGGLNYIDRNKGIQKAFVINSEQQNIVKSLSKDEKGNLWIGTYDGLSYMDTQSGLITNFDITENDSKPENKQVFAVLAAKNGVWMGTDGRGLKFMDREGKFSTYLHNANNNNSISGNTGFCLLKDSEDGLWVGTEHGLSYFDTQTNRFTQFVHHDGKPYSLQHNTILSLFADSKNRLWVGTKGGGVSYYDRSSKHFYTISTNEGLNNGVIHAIKQDVDGNLWLSTNQGLSKIIFKSFTPPFSKNTLRIMNYTVDDGLQSNQFSSGAAETGEDGELLFGGINGLTAFYPNKIIYNTFKPKVVITDFLIKNNPANLGAENSPLSKPIDETEDITLTHDQAFITFKFAALNYLNPDKNQYVYRLRGFYDDEWHYVNNQRTATYTNLDAGKYVFQIRAANNDGVWTDEVKTVRITVLPPWWKTWWAYLLYVCILGLVLYMVYYHLVKTSKLTHELKFQHMSHEKDQELAQRKLSFFTNISHEIKTPLTLILAPIDKLIGLNEGNNKTQNQLRLIQRNGERLVRLIDQLLDFRKFESGNMKLQAAEGNIVRFVKEILMAFESYAHHRRIRIKLMTEQQRIRIWYDRDKLEKVIYNLLSNALKFTNEGGQVIVYIKQLDTQPSNLIIEIEDNGIGIPPHQIDKIFDQFTHFDDKGINTKGTGIGLAFSKGLVELHKGTMHVESTVATPQQQGKTVFRIILPVGKEHLSEDEVIADYKNSEDLDAYRESEISSASRLAIQKRKQQVLQNAGKEKLILLIVEDNLEVQEFVSSHFEPDFEIHTAQNGAVGLQKALELVPDIIISDVMMPEMNGITLCSKLKADARTSHVPVILLTARTPIIFNIEGLETGADDYITKPFNLTMLEARVWNLLDSRQKLRERYRREITLQPTNAAITSPDEKFLERVMKYIEANMAEPTLSVEELGKEVGMSRVTLYRKIKALTNQTAVEFIRSVRLKRAAQLLEQNKLNVNEVAYMVGFLDIDYFRRCFKDEFGFTPKEFANQAVVK
ncbi:two-component regulator propeller domain-containing protein [Mucilaginibacter sp. PAMB04274]|uniref:hybrid sensor histidine kinase/response regulator transcription factor n=1 Tax=Mucilaginibacter sp. PAMB04274 TaxID=3138568 RepID=UPI0031F693EC